MKHYGELSPVGKVALGLQREPLVTSPCRLTTRNNTAQPDDANC